MQFADYLVSAALQSLSRALLKVSEWGDQPRSPEQRSNDLKALANTVERLLSSWQMAQWSIAKLQFERAQSDLKEMLSLCSSGRSPELIAAERLLERADPRSARLLGDIITLLDVPRTTDDGRERLDTLLQMESSRWREYAPLRQIDQSELIEHGILRAFHKSRELSAKLDRISADPEAGRRASAKRLLRTGRWVRHSVNHLELLRPALSDTGRTRRWHLNHLAAKLDDQWALECFARSALLMDLKPKASVRLKRLIDDQRKRFDNQRQKLAQGAFTGGDDSYRQEVTDAVAKLGLQTITLLPVDGGITGTSA